jgi:hypothetical protein
MLRARPLWCAFLAAAVLCPAAAAGTGGIQLLVVPTTIGGPPQVTWSTGDGSPGLVTLAVAGGAQTTLARAAAGSRPLPGIPAGAAYVVRLYSLRPARRLLATATAGGGPARPGGDQPAQRHPPRAPALERRLLQLLPFAGALGLAALALACLRRDA